MRGAAGEARQVAGLLHGGDEVRRELALSRIERLAAEACAGADPATAARDCMELRDAVLALCEEGSLGLSDARLLCRRIDEVQAEALEPVGAMRRSFEALDRATSERSARELPRIAMEAATSADSAQLLLREDGSLAIRAAAGLEIDSSAIASEDSVAARAARLGEPVEATDVEGARTVLAMPFSGAPAAGVLRFSSRTVWQFGEDEKRFFRALTQRAAVLLSSDSERDRLRHTLETFESLIEASPLPIVAVDMRGLVQIWNRAAEALFGWDRGEVLGRPNPMVAPSDRAETQQLIDVVAEGGIVRGLEVRRLRKDGTELDLSLSVAPLRDARGTVSGSIAILADIGDRIRREHEAAETARFRDHFIGIVGHDLRNPLTAIVTSAQLLLRYGNLGEKQARAVTRIGSSADRMARMIDDLLDFARTRLGGGFPIQPRRLNLLELSEHVVEELEFAHPERTVRVQAEGDLWGNWDSDRIAQVISNLVGNALQHSPHEVPILVSLHGHDEVVVLQTHNGGPPIPREVLPHVFEPGRRGDARAGGLGLGLFIVQQIVLAHGGTIEASSSEEQGTTFTVTLPRKSRQKI